MHPVILLLLSSITTDWVWLLIFTRFLDHTQRRTTPLNEWSVRRRDLYLTTHNNHSRQTSMPAVGFELTISAGERPQTYALDAWLLGPAASSSDEVNNEWSYSSSPILYLHGADRTKHHFLLFIVPVVWPFLFALLNLNIVIIVYLNDLERLSAWDDGQCQKYRSRLVQSI